MKTKILACVLCLSVLFALIGCGKSEQTDVSSSIAKPDFSIKAMSFNIHGETWAEHKDNVINFLNNSGCDIIGLQEVKSDCYNDLLNGLKEDYVITFHHTGGGTVGGSIIYNKNVFSLEDKDTFWLSETPDYPTIAWDAYYRRISATVKLTHKATEKSIGVFNVHFDHASQLAQENSATLCVKRADELEYPVIMLGDFNATIDSQCGINMTSGNYVSCQIEDGSDLKGTYNGFGEHDDTPERSAIDHIFIDKNYMKTAKFEIIRDKAPDGSFLSDHNPIRATIDLFF